MKVGLALPTIDQRSGRPATLRQLAERARAAEELGFDSLWVMDHYWTERAPGERRGAHEPFLTLAYLAAQTRRPQLGVLVACNSFRPAGQLGREALTLADASDGRFILGLGAGWHEPEYEAFGIPFDHKVDSLEETLQVLPRLMAGERVDFEGRRLRLRDATLVRTAPPPPVWVAAGGPRMLGLTARHADGWNVAWLGADTARFAAKLAELRAAQAAAGRPESEVVISAGLFVLPEAGADSAGGQAIAGEPEAVAERLLAYGEAGADHLILSLALRPFGEADPSYPERMGRVLELLGASRPGR